MYRGTGVSRGVRRTNWERSLKFWELQISCFEKLLGGENVLGLIPASLPHTLGYACTFYAPTSPSPRVRPNPVFGHFLLHFGLEARNRAAPGSRDCNRRQNSPDFPKNLLKLSSGNNFARQKTTSRKKNNLAGLFFFLL